MIPVKLSDSFVVQNVSGGMAILFYVEKEKKSFIDYFFLTFYEIEVSTLTLFLLFSLSMYITEASRKLNLTV